MQLQGRSQGAGCMRIDASCQYSQCAMCVCRSPLPCLHDQVPSGKERCAALAMSIFICCGVPVVVSVKKKSTSFESYSSTSQIDTLDVVSRGQDHRCPTESDRPHPGSPNHVVDLPSGRLNACACCASCPSFRAQTFRYASLLDIPNSRATSRWRLADRCGLKCRVQRPVANTVRMVAPCRRHGG